MELELFKLELLVALDVALEGALELLVDSSTISHALIEIKDASTRVDTIFFILGLSQFLLLISMNDVVIVDVQFEFLFTIFQFIQKGQYVHNLINIDPIKLVDTFVYTDFIFPSLVIFLGKN